MITEFVKFTPLATTTEDEMIVKSDNNIEGFHKHQPGFVDGELIKDVNSAAWCFVFHYDTMENLKAVGEKIHNSEQHAAFIKLVDPDSIEVSFNTQLKKW